MGITPLKFVGISSFSEDFQTILSRAVSIASIPVQQLQNDQSDILGKRQALGALRSVAADLALSIEALGNIGANRSLSVTSSNTSRVAVTNNGISASGVYHITNISSVATAASENFLTGLDDADSAAVDADGELELVVGTSTYSITLTSETNNLTGLRNAILNSGAEVTATIINSGAETGGNYLSITADRTGESVLQLRSEAGNGASNLMTESNQGANAEFELNGIPMTRSDNTISDVIEGITLNILDETEPGEEVTVTANSSRGKLATALNDFVESYNSVVSAVNAQIGEDAGVLSGESVLRHIQGLLRSVTGYSGSGAVTSLAALGIELDKQGVMTFDSTVFYSLSSAEFESAMDFMGTTTSGFGALAKRIDEISNPITGLIQSQQKALEETDGRIDEQIAAISERILSMQQSMSLRLQQADLLISQFNAQQSQLEAVIEALNTASYGKRTD